MLRSTSGAAADATGGADSASQSWRSFILQAAGGVVASAARDAAVEFSSQSSASTQHPLAAHDSAAGRPTIGAFRTSSARSSARESGRSASSHMNLSEAAAHASANPAAVGVAGGQRTMSATRSGTGRRRPKTSRTSSRASSSRGA